MAGGILASKKRKVPAEVSVVGVDTRSDASGLMEEEDVFRTGTLDGTLSQDEDSEEDEEGESEFETGDELSSGEDDEEEEEEEMDEDDSDDDDDDEEEELEALKKQAGAEKALRHLSIAQKGNVATTTTTKNTTTTRTTEGEGEGEDVNYDSDLEGLPPGTRVEKDANGNPKYVFPEIDPVYDSDDSDAADGENTIGNIPLSLYDMFPHIGYTIDGKKIIRPAAGKALDALLDTIDLPKGWTGMVDKNTGKPLKISKEELGIVAQIQRQMVPKEGEGEYDPYEPTVEWFTSKTEIMPLSSAPEPKRRFVPSKHEAKRIMKIVRAIREGRIVPRKPEDEEPLVPKLYDLWSTPTNAKADPMALPAPKLPPPTHAESYHPPLEYLPNEAEKKEWEELDPEDRPRDFLPHNYNSLRVVPGYNRFVKERFERCLDLYLAPRVRRRRMFVDPETLLPKLPSPQDLRPFPTSCATLYRGHVGRVRTLSVDPRGQWLATGGDDGTVRLWEILTGREVWRAKIGEDGVHVSSVKWRPTVEGGILAAAAGEDIYLIVPPIFDIETETIGREALAAGWGYAAVVQQSNEGSKREPPAKWNKPTDKQSDSGVGVIVTVGMPVKQISWHRRGDYFTTVSPEGQNRSVLIHQISKHHTQSPFRKSKGLIQKVDFHPYKPLIFVATQRYVRIYDLSQQKQIKTLLPGSQWISSFDIHPGGDNLIVGSYDKRLLWHDLDLSAKPYKTMRYHTKAIRAVKYHQGGMPLFCSASDDGDIQVFHGKVFGDLMENALIVPLKVLKGHVIKSSLGVLDVEWHPRECWLFSAGADGTARMWS